VIQSSALWVEKNKEAIEAAVAAAVGGAGRLVWRRAEARLKQDGYTGEMGDVVVAGDTSGSTNSSGGSSGGGEKAAEAAAATDDVVVVENGVRYHVSPDDGQKTGTH